MEMFLLNLPKDVNMDIIGIHIQEYVNKTAPFQYAKVIKNGINNDVNVFAP